MRIVGLLFLSTILGASAQEPGRAMKRAPESGPIERYVGDVLIRTDGDRIIVMMDTVNSDGDPTDGLVDRWFVLQGEQPFATPVAAHLPGAYVVHSPGALRVSSVNRQERYQFVVATGAAEANVSADRTVGVGLSYNFASTNIRIASQLHRGKVSATCMDCEVLDPEPEGGGQSGGATCAGGGSGSTSCSVSGGGSSCSVTCASGYYSCCNTLYNGVTCKCYRNP